MALVSCWSWIPLLWHPLVCVFMNRRNGKITFEDLPDDIVINILSRIPAISVCRSRRVCKRWQRLMSTASFAELHVEKAKHVILMKCGFLYVYIEEEELKNNYMHKCVMRKKKQTHCASPLASCNGLLLYITRYGGPALFIWNPITRESVSLPLPERRRFAVSAFFFHPIKREYMVLFYAADSEYAWFEMLSLRTRSWRRLPGVAYSYPYSFAPPTVVCGAMHWVLDKTLLECGGQSIIDRKKTINSSKFIMRMNLQSEEIDTMPHPDEKSFSGEEKFDLVEMDKRLSLCSKGVDSFDVWILMDYEKWDWVKKYRISLKTLKGYDLYFESMVVARGCRWFGDVRIVNGEVLLHWCGNGFYSCDLQTNKLRRINVEGVSREYRGCFDPHIDTPEFLLYKNGSVFEPHVNSIVSLQKLYGYKREFNVCRSWPPCFLERIERWMLSFL